MKIMSFSPGSSRIKRSPKPRRKHQVNGCPGDAEKDRLITTDSDGTYKRPPGVHNSAYIGCPVRTLTLASGGQREMSEQCQLRPRVGLMLQGQPGRGAHVGAGGDGPLICGET